MAEQVTLIAKMRAEMTVLLAMLVAIWNMLQTGATYNDPGDDFYTRRTPDKAKSRALNQLRNLGYTVTLEPTTEVA